MGNRITRLFEQKKENILSIYFTAGYPRLEDTAPIITELDKAGVDLVEIGMPFSDPLADGPVIQETSQHALKNGMTIAKLFDQLKDIRSKTDLPLILMGYLNPIMQFGEEAFCKQCQAAGIDGLIIPDMPLSYYLDNHVQLFYKQDLINIFLITPDTSEARIKQIDEATKGFIYMVSSNSITGQNKDLSPQESYFKRINNMKLNSPTLVGFGIHDKVTFDMACSYANGAIIGTAFLKAIDNSDLSTAIPAFVKSIRG